MVDCWEVTEYTGGEGGNQIFSFAVPVGLNQPGIYSLIFENLFWQNSVNLIVQEYLNM